MKPQSKNIYISAIVFSVRFVYTTIREMYLFQRCADLQDWLKTVRGHNRKVGFVPTMGALHDGHLSLIRQSKAADSCTVCSIFVNPTQFNDTTDLEKYPRTPARDIELLAGTECDALFLPSVEEVYPIGTHDGIKVDLEGLDEVLEGAFRPGHFAGVVQVVHRLLGLVRPDRLYMGQKDYQQLTIIRQMIRQLNLPVELVMADIRRENDGLAMSSRNVRLSPEFRAIAPVIYQVLQNVQEQAGHRTVAESKSWALQQLTEAGLKPEYFEIIDGYNLRNIDSWAAADLVVACVAAWAGEIRLIDNVIIEL